MRQEQKVAVAVIAFAGTEDLFAYRITGEGDYPLLEMRRFMQAVDMAIDRIEPYGLQIMAQNLFDPRMVEVTVAMDFEWGEIAGIMESGNVAELRTV